MNRNYQRKKVINVRGLWPWGSLYIVVALLLIDNNSIKPVEGQLDAVSAVFSVVPVTSILATAGFVGVKLAALSRLLQALGYDQAYLANGGSGTAAEPIGLQTKYAYMFPYVPGLNISVKGEHATQYQNVAQQQREAAEHLATRKTYPSMSLPGDYESQNRPFRGVETLREVLNSAGIKMLIPTRQQPYSKGNGQVEQEAFNSQSFESFNNQQATTPLYNVQQQQQQQPPNAPDVIPPPSHHKIPMKNVEPTRLIEQNNQQQQSSSSFPAHEQSGQQHQLPAQGQQGTNLQQQQQQQFHHPQIQLLQQQVRGSQVNMPHPHNNHPHPQHQQQNHPSPPGPASSPQSSSSSTQSNPQQGASSSSLMHHAVPTSGLSSFATLASSTASAPTRSPIPTHSYAPTLSPSFEAPTQTSPSLSEEASGSATASGVSSKPSNEYPWPFDQFHPIPQHEYYHQLVVDRQRARPKIEANRFHWGRVELPSNDNNFNYLPEAVVETGTPMPINFEDFEKELYSRQHNGNHNIPLSTNINFNSPSLSSSSDFPTNLIPFSPVTDGPPPFNDEMDQNEFNLVNRRRKRDLGESPKTVSLADRIMVAAGERNSAGKFGMPAANIYSLRRRRRSLANKIMIIS